MNPSGILKDIYVSRYPLASSLANQKILLLDELLKIKSGYYKSLINSCREAFHKDRKQYAILKLKLPAVTFCGVFNGPHKKENLVTYNNIVIIDIDHIPEEDFLLIRGALLLDRYVLACWTSPSGNGLKLLIRVESSPLMHKFTFDRIVDHLLATYDIQADISGSDVCRLCFISFDEDLFLNENSEIFPLHEDEWLVSLIAVDNIKLVVKSSNPIERREEIFTLSEKMLFSKTEGRNKGPHRDMIKKIISYLKKNKKTITGNYPHWVKVALAVSNAFTYEIGKNIFLELCRLDGSFHDEDKSECLLQYCYRKRKAQEVNFGTIIYLAQQQGFIVRSKSIK